MKINKTNEFIEVIGHYDNEAQCAKMTLLADLYAIEHREGYAKFPLNVADKLGLVDEKLEFRPITTIYVDDIILTYNSGNTFTINQNGFTIYYYDVINIPNYSKSNGTYTYTGEGTFKGLKYNGTIYTSGQTINIADDDNQHFLTTEIGSTPKISVDLTTLDHWGDLAAGTHSITVRAKATGYRDSEPSQAVSVEKAPSLPVKGQIINMNLDGTSRQYRVLTTSGTQAEVVAMFDPNTSIKFDSNNTYNSSTLDTYLNTTWYGGLTTTAKNAIVSKTLTQYQYSNNDSAYDATTHASYAKYSTKSVKASGLSRKVYALDVEDIENYFNHTFSTADIWELFWNVRSTPTTATYPWLRSARATNTSGVWCVFGNFGLVDIGSVGTSYAARPAFTIDLSKIEWTPSN